MTYSQYKHRRNPKVRLRDWARRRALKKGIAFELKSWKDVPDVPDVCPILNIPIFIAGENSTDNSPTLDRIDNKKGYVKSNLMVISRKANQSKSNLSFKELEMLYYYMKKVIDEKRR